MKKLLALLSSLVFVLVAYGADGRAPTASTWETGRFQPVTSRVFHSAKYEPNTRTLTLLFRSGGVYEYYGVSPKTWFTFMRVRHKASFFNAHIRRAYDYARVGTTP